MIEERRRAKQKVNECRDEEVNEQLSTTYRALNKAVTKSARKDKRHSRHTLSTEAERTEGEGDFITLCQITRSLSGKR